MQLLQLHAVDQQILETERGLRECRQELSELSDGVLSLEDGLEQLLSRLQDLRLEARHGERAVEDKHVLLIRVQGRVSNVQNERQYSAATLEADLLKSDLRTLENQVLDKLQPLMKQLLASPDSVASAVLYAVSQPIEVNVADIVVRPAKQLQL